LCGRLEEFVLHLPMRDAIVQLMPCLHERRKVAARGARQPRNQVFDIDLSAVDVLVPNRSEYFWRISARTVADEDSDTAPLLGLG
jgi:hypothetical protein